MLITTHVEPVNQAISATVYLPTLGQSLTLRSDCQSRPVDRRWPLTGLHPGEPIVVAVAGRTLRATADASGAVTVEWDGRDAAGHTVDSAVATVTASTGPHRMRLGRWDARRIGLGGFLLSGYDHLDVTARRIRTGHGRLIGKVALSRDDIGFRVPRRDGRGVAYFDAHGYVYRMTGADGATIAHWSRDDTGLTGQSSHTGQLVVRRGGASILMDRHDRRTVLECDGDGRVRALRDCAGNTMRIEWDERGLLVGLTEPTGFEHRYDYDDDARLIVVRRPGHGPTRLRRTELDNGHRITVLTAELRETSYSFETLPDGTRVRTQRCCGRPPQTTRISGSTVEVTRGDGGRIISDRRSGERRIVLPSGLTNTRVARDDAIVINGNVWRRSVTSRETVTVTPEGRITRAEFRPGRIDVSGPEGSSSIDHDAATGAVTRRSPAGAMTLHSNEIGSLARVDYDDGRQVSFDYDAAGWLNGQQMPDGRSLRMDRAADGTVRSITPPGKEPTTVTFDAPARASTIRFAGSDADALRYSYDGDGLVVARQSGDGPRLETVRDADGRIREVTGSAALMRAEYADGRPVRVQTGDGAQTTEFTWDGPLLTATTGTGVAPGRVERSYDADFLLRELRCGSLAVPVRRDRDGLIVGLGPATITRDGAGDVVSVAAGAVRQRWQRDELRRPVAMVLDVAGRVIWQVNYRYDAQGRIAALTDSQTPTPSGSAPPESVFAYDTAGRVVSARGPWPLDVDWDDNGNATRLQRDTAATSATYDPADRVMTVHGRPVRHDASGRLTDRPCPVTGVDEHFGYDEAGGLISVQTGDASVRLVRDGLSNLVAIESGGVVRHRFVPGPDGYPDADVSDSGRPRALYAGYARDRPPALALETSRALFLAADHLGSLRFAVDVSSGAIVERRVYDHSGRLRLRHGDARIPFGWGGGMTDGVTPLTHMPARSYDPGSMRFLSRDPLLFRTGETNLYLFAGGDPINRRDPTGLQQVEVCRQATGVGGFAAPGAEHWWIRQGGVESGMGAAPQGTTLENLIQDVAGLPPTQVTDHGNRSAGDGVTCDPVEKVDEKCVAQAIDTGPTGLGDRLGTYSPLGNTCQDWVDDVLTRCSGGDYVIRTDDPDAYDHYYNPTSSDQTAPKTQSTDSGSDGGSDSGSDGESDSSDGPEWNRYGPNPIGPDGPIWGG